MSLPKGWASATLGDLATYINGRGFKKSEWKTEGIPIIRIQNLNDENASFNYADDSFEEKYRVKNGDLLVAWSASLGAYIWKHQDAWLNQHIFRVEPSNIVDKYFLYYAISESINELYKKAHGMGMVHITKGKFEAHEISLPPLNEQRRISKKLDELLSSVESIKTRLDKAPSIIKRLRQAILVSATSGKLTEEWRKENESSEFIEKTLGSLVVKTANGLSKRSGTEGKDIVVLRLADFKNGVRIFGNEREIKLTKKEQEKYILDLNDILVVRVNGSKDIAGLFTIYKGKDEAYCDHFIRLSLNNELILPEYAMYVANEGKGREYIRNKLVSNAGQNTINQKSLFGLKIPLPSIEEQKEIVSQVESLFALADDLEAKIEAAKKRVDKLAQSILAKAFRGELVGQDPNDETAEKLLDRIKAEHENNKPKKKAIRKKSDKPNKALSACSTVEKLSAFLIKEFNKKEFTIEDVYSITQCDKQKLINFIFQLVKEQKFVVNEDTYEIYNLWKDDKQVLKVNKVN